MKKTVTGAERKKPVRASGEIVSLADAGELDFSGTGKLSVYRGLLLKLMDAPKESALKVGRLNARACIKKQGAGLGYKLAFAKKDGALYVKIVGVTDDARPAVRDGAAGNGQAKACPTKEHGPMGMILTALSRGPMTLKEIARVLGAHMGSCVPTMEALVERGSVEDDGGIYRLAGKK